MFDILDFIDSKDIREHNRYTKFSPIEQAYLICYSRKTTVEAKMAAWRELLTTYSEEEFEETSLGKMRLDKAKSNKQVLRDTLAICEDALLMQKNCDGLLYEANYYKRNSPAEGFRMYFKDYDAAYTYLKETHEREEEQWSGPGWAEIAEDFTQGSAVAKIAVRPFGKNEWFNTTFYFDNDLRLTTVDPTHEVYSTGLSNAAYLFIHIPLPLQKGDIVRLTRLTDTKFGVISETPDEAYYRDLLAQIRSNTYEEPELVYITLDTYDPEEGSLGIFERNGYNPLEFELCSDEELPRDRRNLILLREVYLGQLPAGQFMDVYSRFGKDAHSCW